jgi:AbrB family looped-hinge helix DNA binding protein
MIAKSKVTTKNQTTIPKSVIDALGLKPADQIFYEIEEGKVILHSKTKRLVDLKDEFRHLGRKQPYPVSIDEMHEAVMDAVAENKVKYGKLNDKANTRKARRS